MADGSGRSVVVLEDGRALGALDAVVEGVELVSATGEELHALLEAGYVLSGTGLTERPLLPWRYGEPVAMDVLRESPRRGLVSDRDARWAVEWVTEDGHSSLWIGSGATAHEALADARAECYASEIESGELVAHKLQEGGGQLQETSGACPGRPFPGCGTGNSRVVDPDPARTSASLRGIRTRWRGRKMTTLITGDQGNRPEDIRGRTVHFRS